MTKKLFDADSWFVIHNRESLKPGRSIARGLLLILVAFALTGGILLILADADKPMTQIPQEANLEPTTTLQPMGWLAALSDIADMLRILRGEPQQLVQPEPANTESRSSGGIAGWLCAGAMGTGALITSGVAAYFWLRARAEAAQATRQALQAQEYQNAINATATAPTMNLNATAAAGLRNATATAQAESAAATACAVSEGPLSPRMFTAVTTADGARAIGSTRPRRSGRPTRSLAG